VYLSARQQEGKTVTDTASILIEVESSTLDGDQLAHLVQTFLERLDDVDYSTVKEIDGLGA
jgi:hypothetical protein